MAETAQRDMAFGIVNAFIIVVHNKRSPSDEEWAEYLQIAQTLGVDHGTAVRYLIVTEGGAPTFTQQKAMNEELALVRTKHPSALFTAIVTPSTFVRGLIAALGLIHPVYRGFTPDNMLGAYQHLGIPPSYYPEIEALIATLKAQLRP